MGGGPNETSPEPALTIRVPLPPSRGLHVVLLVAEMPPVHCPFLGSDYPGGEAPRLFAATLFTVAFLRPPHRQEAALKAAADADTKTVHAARARDEAMQRLATLESGHTLELKLQVCLFSRPLPRPPHLREPYAAGLRCGAVGIPQCSRLTGLCTVQCR